MTAEPLCPIYPQGLPVRDMSIASNWRKLEKKNVDESRGNLSTTDWQCLELCTGPRHLLRALW